MSEMRAHVALLVDYACLRHVAADCSAGRCSATPTSGKSRKKNGAVELEAPATPCAGVMGKSLRHLAAQLGRLGIARAYADWTREPEVARDLTAASLETVLVPATPEGVERGNVRLAVEALTALYAGDEPDAFVLVTADATLLPLVQALRADGSEVVLVAPEVTLPPEMKDAADRCFTLEQVLEGVEVEALVPRVWRSDRGDGEEGGSRGRLGGNGSARGDETPRRERVPHPTPVRCEEDFGGYDWAPFIKLIDELEHRLPFVGVRYLVNKVLGSHNCGVEDPHLKRDLINRAVDDGLLEMYPVGNVGDRADPVTACRLDRHSANVVAILGATTTPEAPAEEPGVGAMAGGDDEDEVP